MLSDRFAAATLVADATLFEGYVLYPYRASARKNQLRWQFGVLCPPEYARSSGSERFSMRTEVIVDAQRDALLHVRIRCLHVQRRTVERSDDGGATFVAAASIRHDGRDIISWDEAEEQTIDLDPLAVGAAARTEFEQQFALPAVSSVELLSDGATTIGRVLRSRQHVDALARVAVVALRGSRRFKVTVDVVNTTEWDEPSATRDMAMGKSLIAVHTLLAVDNASFVSLLEPQPDAEVAVASCCNEGTFPVLIGDDAARNLMLSSPIILYDFPAVAPESAGDFCDATEIDEILALRVMTLTDEEKAEARGTDARAAAIVDRCDEMPDELWSRLHGAVRSLRPVATQPDDATPWWDPGIDASFDPFTDVIKIGGVDVGVGTPVRLRPSRRADAHDLFYAGRTATVKGVFNDVDGNQHLAVMLDDDAEAGQLDWQGRYLYFHPDEVEVLAVSEPKVDR
jgi:hypothetical protein